MGHHADDGALWRTAGIGERARGRTLEEPKPQAGANRVLAGGPELRRRFVDHRNAIAAPDLRRIEHPSTPQGDAERAQVIGPAQVDPNPFRVVRELPDDGEL